MEDEDALTDRNLSVLQILPWRRDTRVWDMVSTVMLGELRENLGKKRGDREKPQEHRRRERVFNLCRRPNHESFCLSELPSIRVVAVVTSGNPYLGAYLLLF